MTFMNNFLDNTTSREYRLEQNPFLYDDVIKLKHFPRYWPFVREIHWPPVNSPHKGQWRHNLNRPSEVRCRCVKIVFVIAIYGLIVSHKKLNNTCIVLTSCLWTCFQRYIKFSRIYVMWLLQINRFSTIISFLFLIIQLRVMRTEVGRLEWTRSRLLIPCVWAVIKFILHTTVLYL